MPNIKPNISAIILAAGNGSRFGGDKLLHEIEYTNNKDSITSKSIGLISALNVLPHVDEVVCVVRPNDTQLIKLLEPHPFTIVTNKDYQQGLSSSIKAGVLAVKPANNIMICLADMPFIKTHSYQAVIDGFNADKNTVCRPVFFNEHSILKPGHPVIIPNKFKDKLMKLNADKGAQLLIQSLPVHTVRLVDQGVIRDIDRKEDLQQKTN
jgi:molybdenum cofactor cytidylyltransferase